MLNLHPRSAIAGPQLPEHLTMRYGPFNHDERIALAMLGLVVLADVACFAILAALLCGRLPF
jgi:hypothetical protein